MFSRLVPRFVLPAIGLLATLAPSAYAAGQNRISSTINEDSQVPLQHTVAARALAANDLGSAPGDRTLSSLTLRFNMSAAQQADLTQLLLDLQDPSSPSYHQWLTPQQFGARFGLSSADLAKVSGWLAGKGFTVTRTAPSAP